MSSVATYRQNYRTAERPRHSRVEVSCRRGNHYRQSGSCRCQVKRHRQVGDYHCVPGVKREAMICDICGREGARVRHVARSYGKGANLFVIEDVPVVSCPHCGKSYLTAETLHEIERIKLHQQSFARERPVPVAVFA
jgi:YgiT-type zinc finger domain-containing protein